MACLSPDSSRIAFAAHLGNVVGGEPNTDIYVVNRDGSGLRRLTDAPRTDDMPVGAPDDRIYFRSSRDGNLEIYVMSSDGTGQVNLTNQPSNEGGAIPSPDGRQIAFFSDRDGNQDLFVMNSDGTDQVNVSRSPGIEVEASWSRDGKWLALVRCWGRLRRSAAPPQREVPRAGALRKKHGNRLAYTDTAAPVALTTYTYDAADRLTSLTQAGLMLNYAWSDRGELLSDGSQTYQWDAAGRLAGVSVPGGLAVSYTYDGANDRLAMAVDGVATAYVVDPLFPVDAVPQEWLQMACYPLVGALRTPESTMTPSQGASAGLAPAT